MRKTISLLLMILVVAYSCCSFADSLPSEYVMAGDDMATNNGDVFPVVDDSWFTDDEMTLLIMSTLRKWYYDQSPYKSAFENQQYLLLLDAPTVFRTEYVENSCTVYCACEFCEYCLYRESDESFSMMCCGYLCQTFIIQYVIEDGKWTLGVLTLPQEDNVLIPGQVTGQQGVNGLTEDMIEIMNHNSKIDTYEEIYLRESGLSNKVTLESDDYVTEMEWIPKGCVREDCPPLDDAWFAVDEEKVLLMKTLRQWYCEESPRSGKRFMDQQYVVILNPFIFGIDYNDSEKTIYCLCNFDEYYMYSDATSKKYLCFGDYWYQALRADYEKNGNQWLLKSVTLPGKDDELIPGCGIGTQGMNGMSDELIERTIAENYTGSTEEYARIYLVRNNLEDTEIIYE